MFIKTLFNRVWMQWDSPDSRLHFFLDFWKWILKTSGSVSTPLLHPRAGCKVLQSACLYVCFSIYLSVCPFTCLENHTSQFHQIVCVMLPVAVTQSSSDTSVILCVLPVLWRTFFYIMEQMDQNQRQHVRFVEFSRWRHWRQSVPSPATSCLLCWPRLAESTM